MVMLALLWVLLIRPQRRRQQQQTSMLDSLDVGDEIVTAGGLYGTVQAIGEDEASVEIAPGTTVRIAKRAVAAVMPPDEDEDGGEIGEEALEEAEEEPEAGATESRDPARS